MNQPKNNTHFGFVAIMGRPNVGKSTLLNRILGKKISITARKPQTTRHRLLGLKTIDHTQIAYVDTPGIHRAEKREINRYLNRAAKNAVQGVNLILMLIDAHQFKEEDEFALAQLSSTDIPVILVINKIDQVDRKEQLLPFIEQVKQRYDFVDLIPISAKTGDQVDRLEQEIMRYIPQEMHLFPADMVTDRNEAFLVAETIREKLIRSLGQEVPYSSAVTLEAFENKPAILRVAAIIWVEKPGQKAIVIGKGGERLKQIGSQARLDLEKQFSKKVYMQLWVKVKNNWSDDARSLQNFGYGES